MKILRKYKLFLEYNDFLSTQSQYDLEKPKMYYNPKNIVFEICTSMVLLNNQFLDKLLDRGMKARYNENSQVFLTDLKNLLLSNNRLKLGILKNDKYVGDSELSKINGLFEEVNFSIEDDWNTLIDARIMARNIKDKLLIDDKLDSDRIKNIYWIGPNKSKDYDEDIIIETTDGKQFSVYFDKSLSKKKSSSFNKYLDDIIEEDSDKMFSEENKPKWDKLIQNWVRIIYENVGDNIKVHIEKFIEPDRIDSLDWFDYFKLKHRDPKFKNLGEHIKEFDKNILLFSDLMKEVWKNKNRSFNDVDKVVNQWNEVKIIILNSKILERMLTKSLINNYPGDIKKLKDGFKIAKGRAKMKMLKNIVEKLDLSERVVYYFDKKGNELQIVPSRDFFRNNYDDISVKFDYNVDTTDKSKDYFNIKVLVDFGNRPLLDLDIEVKFSGSELSSKLSASYKFNLVNQFNSIIADNI